MGLEKSSIAPDFFFFYVSSGDQTQVLITICASTPALHTLALNTQQIYTESQALPAFDKVGQWALILPGHRVRPAVSTVLCVSELLSRCASSFQTKTQKGIMKVAWKITIAVKEPLRKVVLCASLSQGKRKIHSLAFVKTSRLLLSGLQIHFAFFFSLGLSM